MGQYLDKLGMPAPDGVDVDVFYVPSGVTVTKAADLGAPPPPPPAPLMLPPGQPDPSAPAEPPAQQSVRTLAPVRETNTSAALAEVLADLTRARIAATGTASLARLFDEILSRVIVRYGLRATSDDIDAVIADLLDDDDRTALLAALAVLATLAVADAWTDAVSVLASLGVANALAFDAESAAVLAILKTVASDAVGMANGETHPEITERLRQSSAFGQSRAATIAETEGGVAYNLGTLAAYQQSDAVESVLVSDGDYDPVCAGLNGTTQTLAWAQSHPLGHPNCRRRFTPVLATVPAVT